MHSSTKLAFGILLLWLCGVCLFVAFHPGGVQLTGDDGKDHEAGNPADVIKFIFTQRQFLGNLGKPITVNPDGSISEPPDPNV